MNKRLNAQAQIVIWSTCFFKSGFFDSSGNLVFGCKLFVLVVKHDCDDHIRGAVLGWGNSVATNN